jgi:integrase
VPLIALCSGLRLGEIIQMQVADVKVMEGIKYFDVTPLAFEVDDEEGYDPTEEKSLKTASSRRGVPIHRTLLDLGFEEFLGFRRATGESRLFPDFGRAKDDGSWSKQFSKYFKRFRESVGVTRRGVKFHSLRHNVEDALRNADVRKEVRDAVQGHGENGVSREYGSGYYLKTLNESVQKIRYDGVRLPL